MHTDVQAIITKMLADEFGITTNETLLNADDSQLAVMYENMKTIQERFGLSDDDMAKVCDKIFQ